MGDDDLISGLIDGFAAAVVASGTAISLEGSEFELEEGSTAEEA